MSIFKSNMPQNINPDDPLAQLHRMSTTAGLGSQDYVAINATAIAAILLGLLSALCLFSSIFLVIPPVAILCAIIAWFRIRRSNGTQGGRGLALAGLFLAASLGGIKLSHELLQHMRVIPEQQQIAQLMTRMGDLAKAKQWDELWGLYSERFKTERAKVTRQQFIQRWTDLQGPMRGQLRSIKWNGVNMVFQTDTRTGFPLAAGMVILDLENTTPWRQTVIFRKVAERWLIDDMPQLFPPPRNPAESP